MAFIVMNSKYDFHEAAERLISLGIFDHCRHDYWIYNFDLIGTRFRLVINNHQTYWVQRMIVKKEDYNNSQGSLVWEEVRKISFENVLDLVEPEIQTKLLFCLDLFR